MNGVIFDLDGVIVDTAVYHFLSWKTISESIGFSLTESDNEFLKGKGRSESLDQILEWAKTSLSPSEKEELLVKKNTLYLEYIEKLTKKDILPGTVFVLDFFKRHNTPIGLGSASKNAVFILEKLDLISYFDVIVDGNSVKKSKPDPEVFSLGAQKMNLPAENCTVFEDSILGIQAANSIGMQTIGVGDSKKLTACTHCFKDLEMISEDFLLEKIVNK